MQNAKQTKYYFNRHNHMTDTTMSSLEARISALEAEIAKLVKREDEATSEERRDILNARITETRKTLNLLIQQHSAGKECVKFPMTAVHLTSVVVCPFNIC
jgi:predicted transcriptional regulator